MGQKVEEGCVGDLGTVELATFQTLSRFLKRLRVFFLAIPRGLLKCRTKKRRGGFALRANPAASCSSPSPPLPPLGSKELL